MILKLLISYFLIVLIGGSHADDIDDKLKVLESDLTAKLNSEILRLETQLTDLQATLTSRLDEHEAKLQIYERKIKSFTQTRGGTSSSSSASKTSGKDAASSKQVVELESQFNLLQQQVRNNTVSHQVLHDATNPIHQQLQVLKKVIDEVNREEKDSKTSETTQIILDKLLKLELEYKLDKRKKVVELIRVAFSAGNTTEVRAGVNDLNDDLDLAMPEIIKHTYQNKLLNFDSILNFAKYWTVTQKQAGYIRLAEAMKVNNQVDTREYVRLAALVKKEFGKTLEQHFPVTLQGMIWSRHLCLIGSTSRGYLTANASRKVAGKTNAYEVYTEVQTSASDYCKWKFTPVNDQKAFFLSYSHGSRRIKTYWDLVVSNGKAYAQSLQSLSAILSSSAQLNWDVTTKENGLKLVLKSLSPPTYLCTDTTTSATNRTETTVSLSSTFSSNCEWFVQTV